MIIKNKESGITLIALIITVIIIVITTSVTLSLLSEDDGIVNIAFESREDYIELNDKQQINQLIESIIKEYQISGQNISLSNIAQKMNEQGWIKTATADEDILITTENGYVYQFYYNEQYGQRFVEYLGIGNENDFPEITTTYDSQTQTITVNSTAAQRIELMYNDYDEIVKTVNGTSLNYTAQNTGWYIAKAISSNGKIKYAWIRAAVQNFGINFEITSVGIMDNGWYGKDNIPVDIRISANANEIYYKLGTAENYMHVENDSTTIQINTIGKTTVYAYSVDESGRQSEISSISVKYDNIRPEIGEIVIEGEARESGVYKSDIVISLSNMLDSGSGIQGYSYWLIDDNASNEVFLQENRSITVKSEGIKKIGFQAKDKAGNLSDIQTITVEKAKFSAGDYVDYNPVIATSVYPYLTSTYTGSEENTVNFVTEDFNWVVWSKDENTLTLIADGVTSVGGPGGNEYNGQLRLNGAIGYGNAVKLLNDFCEHYYSNEALGATARSINSNDIRFAYNSNVYTPEQYYTTPPGKSERYYAYGTAITDTTNRYYPFLFQYEKYAEIVNTDSQISGSVDQNEQPNNQFYTENDIDQKIKRATVSISSPRTSWYVTNVQNNYKSSTYYKLVYKYLSDNSNLPTYYLASRGVTFPNGSDQVDRLAFTLMYVGNSYIYNERSGWGNVIVLGNTGSTVGACIRPMVEIDLSVVNVGQNGLGTADSPYNIEAR